jgi:hypothetical protein
VSERLPLFPLGAVLFPGLVMPLHIFEERYRLLVADLLDRPADEPRRFGVVAIELGHEVGQGAARRIAAIGCTAEVHGVTRYDDGRYDLICTGGERFRVDRVAGDDPYPVADVTPLPDDAGPVEPTAAESVTRLFRRYTERLNAASDAAADQAARDAGAEADDESADPAEDVQAAAPGLVARLTLPEELPTEPVPLSYLVAATMLIGRAERQRLLGAEHAAARLDRERELLLREIRLLRRLRSIPADNLLTDPVTPN